MRFNVTHGMFHKQCASSVVHKTSNVALAPQFAFVSVIHRVKTNNEDGNEMHDRLFTMFFG